MAGAEPRQLRTILATLEALLDERFNLNGLQSTTHCATPLVIVSGPHAAEAGLAAGNNVLGNGHRGNLSVGRAVRLVMTNVGGGRPGETDMSVQGTPAKISFCVAERLDAGCWPSLAERQGGEPGETSVTVMAADGPVIIDLPQAVDAAGNNHARRMLLRDVANLRHDFARHAPALLSTQYGPEIWSLYERGVLTPQTPLTGHFEAPRGPADVGAVLQVIDDARAEEAARLVSLRSAG